MRGDGAAGEVNVLSHKVINGAAQLVLGLGFGSGWVDAVDLVFH